MSTTPAVLSTPVLGGLGLAASPRRPSYPAGPSSPRLRNITPSRLPSISANQPLEFDYPDSPVRTNFVTGFSPPGSNAPLAVGSPSNASFMSLNRARLSPQPVTPVEAFPNFPDFPSSPRLHSPRPHYDLPPRSRRNSALVSISLSTRSRSRTPRGSSAALPSGSGQGTPNKSKDATPRGDSGNAKGREIVVQMMDHPSAPGLEEMDDWSPAGGMLLHDDDEDEEALSDEEVERIYSERSDASRLVEDVLKPGMIFGEGLEFQGEIVLPAVGRVMTTDEGEKIGMPLRRGGSEAGVGRGSSLGREVTPKKSYEVVRQLGSGSYAVVYLVKERGGKKREYALKCLSKHDLEEENLETQLFEATIHLSLPIHTNIVTLHQTLQTKKWLFLMLELCPGEDLFYWLEKSRDASPPTAAAQLHDELLSSSKMSSSSIPFSSSQMFPSITASSFSHSPSTAFSPSYSPASLLFAHHNGSHHMTPSQTPPTPSLLSAFSANTLLTSRRLRLIASMFSQMCEAVAVCHDAGISHRDIKPENFICCDSVELESGEGDLDFGPQAKRKVIVKLTDFGLATTEEESGDVECGSKPYMSYECRNNLGPKYCPGPADVWSLGIVLINMLFHRNPWKDPCPGDPNFDTFLEDPTSFLLTKFTGIGRDVASFLADHVLCIDVEARTTARELGIWIKSLPDMIGGRRAIQAMKMARLETKTISIDQGLFVKSPVDQRTERKASWTSALTSSAPALSMLPPPSSLITPDLDREFHTASTIDEQTTPSEMASPEPDDVPRFVDDDGDTRSLSTTKRRKRGVRKGKAAQAALALAAAADKPTQAERDALLAELAEASQSLARDLSKVSSAPFDPTRIEDFPPLGTTPSQLAAAKKSKWKDLMKLSHGNPELAALARRVSERDDISGGNWSAPANLQGGSKGDRPALKQTATASSGFSSALSSFGPVSSATSSSGGPDDDDWRKPRPEETRGRGHDKSDIRGKNESSSRARQAALAAAAITSSFEMGSFGRPDYPPRPVRSAVSVPIVPRPSAPLRSNLSSRPLGPIIDEHTPEIYSQPLQSPPMRPASSVDSASTITVMNTTFSGTEVTHSSPNKPKLKGQIQSLAKMLSGLKTKGKD